MALPGTLFIYLCVSTFDLLLFFYVSNKNATIAGVKAFDESKAASIRVITHQRAPRRLMESVDLVV